MGNKEFRSISNAFCLLCLGGSLIVQSGCTKVGPNYTPPQLNTAAKWVESEGKQIKNDTVELKDWWKVFNDPILDSLIKTAYEQNLSLRTAGVRVLEARARLAVAIGNYYPQQQQASGAFNFNRTSENDGTSGGSFRQLQLGVGASWEIDFWGKFSRAVQAGDASLLASMASYDSSLVSVLGEVANTYVVIRVLEEQLLIGQENVKIQKQSLKIADARFKGGESSERDVQQAFTQLHSTEASIPQLEISLQQAKNALSILLGINPAELGDRLSGKVAVPTAPAQIAVGIPADLLRRRPDIRSAELTAIAQSEQIGITQAELYPSFSLSGDFNLVAADAGNAKLGDFLSFGSRSAVVGPSFRWNFLNYGQITNAVRVQDAVFQESITNYQNTVLLAQREVEDALVSFAKSAQIVHYLTQATAAARKTVELANAQYQGGATDYTTVINALSALLQQQNALAQSRGAVPQALIAVYRALGGGWEIREGKDFVSDEIKGEMKKRTDWGHLLDSTVSGADTKPVW